MGFFSKLFGKTDVDEKVAEKAKEVLDKTDIDDKIVEKVQEVKENITEKFKKD